MPDQKLQQAETDYNPQGRRGRPVIWTMDDVKFIRESVETMADPAIARALGWKLWRVIDVRNKFNIPAHQKDGFWTEERMEIIQRRCIDNCEPSSAVARDIGCSEIALRRKLSREGLKRDPKALSERRAADVRRFVGNNHQAVARHASVPAHAERPRFTFGAATPIIFAAPPVETETLGDRILRELSAKPLSASSLATLLGEKELLVSMQLSAFAHLGLVEAGPVGERGLRHRVWSSLAESAASVPCGPDSSVVAGEAA